MVSDTRYPIPMLKADNLLHIWKIPLNLAESALYGLVPVLDEQEKAKAAHFRFPKHRRRYIVAHAAMRYILGSQLEILPQDLELLISEKEKPYIAENPLYFNLSHSEEMAILATSFQAEVGIDIEHLKPEIDTLGIAQRFFHPIELAQLEQASPEQRLKIFYTFWTGKEAYLKAKGVGITNHLQHFALELQDAQKLRIHSVKEEFEGMQDWFVDNFEIEPDYIITAVCLKMPHQIEFHEFNFAKMKL